MREKIHYVAPDTQHKVKAEYIQLICGELKYTLYSTGDSSALGLLFAVKGFSPSFLKDHLSLVG